MLDRTILITYNEATKKKEKQIGTEDKNSSD